MVSKEININVKYYETDDAIPKLIQTACKFNSKISLNSGSKSVNAKSIMGMMSLGLSQNAEVTISAEGEDEQAAVTALAQYLENVRDGYITNNAFYRNTRNKYWKGIN